MPAEAETVLMAVKHADVVKARKDAAAPRQGVIGASAADPPAGALQQAASVTTPQWSSRALWAIIALMALVAVVLRAAVPAGLQFPSRDTLPPGQPVYLAMPCRHDH